MPLLLDGKHCADRIVDEIKTKVSQFSSSCDIKRRPPGLAFILVGSHLASRSYLNMKRRRCREAGFFSVDRELRESSSEEELLAVIAELNANPVIDGILIQLPLPKGLRPLKMLQAVDPSKDVDGFHPLNVGKLLLGEEDGFVPCTPLGILRLLQEAKISPDGQRVVIVGRSNIVGKPLAAALMQKKRGANATVTLAHTGTLHLVEVCRSADILIAAMGSPGFITEKMVKERAVVIDVGINCVDGRLVGDVAFDEVAPKCRAITPVPGGVGPMTIAMLLENTLLSYERCFKR
ncbi:MAG: bifunctional 5,10-methylene-tetrahydrofolate dehydrogenase/5,10-methylene-tetrahydrofolate cyclohydrolase [Chlamydiae bacterium RIFCSPHIGHO2_02_FULL_49_29]|nr:MAG: bifunctional 5,10-methylene-tetrahydrofolate dehydrogenase/5,10-methylene-tetrahydrofolate cyclohydrolase [Chlamydiae bacterium RIFCSPHIGHO2_02_FULL_49_29]